MYNSDDIGARENERMSPKDERLVLMAYNVGRLQVREDECHQLRRDNQELQSQVERAQAEADRERRWRDNLQETYDRLNKHALKMEKQLDKLRKESK